MLKLTQSVAKDQEAEVRPSNQQSMSWRAHLLGAQFLGK